MRRIVPTALICLALAVPATAQEAPETETERGFDLLREGSRMILEGLMDDMRPMLEEARPFFEEEMLPFLESLGTLIDDMTAYEMPERLPNGDIIIRRKPDAPPLPDTGQDVGEGGEVEL
ncbi:AAA+ family ATPase [Roseibacterium sp. SDUM158017]|uniref:AAA+ family ATPase n=1 Tax=Roseicyclus salinarum TaxID=3036773 RepID=UPI0024158D70|nr:AAA+ family ATPase [Roseibacterium sp. SDUM158017]MDG4647461.1 AAA+ family ATPase [Roseibacterium sp. SDUM158017]